MNQINIVLCLKMFKDSLRAAGVPALDFDTLLSRCDPVFLLAEIINGEFCNFSDLTLLEIDCIINTWDLIRNRI